MEKNRLEKAKQYYETETEKSKNLVSIENPIWEIKHDILVFIFEEIFEEKPTEEEQRWINAEEEEIEIFENTETF